MHTRLIFNQSRIYSSIYVVIQSVAHLESSLTLNTLTHSLFYFWAQSTRLTQIRLLHTKHHLSLHSVLLLFGPSILFSYSPVFSRPLSFSQFRPRPLPHLLCHPLLRSAWQSLARRKPSLMHQWQLSLGGLKKQGIVLKAYYGPQRSQVNLSERNRFLLPCSAEYLSIQVSQRMDWIPLSCHIFKINPHLALWSLSKFSLWDWNPTFSLSAFIEHIKWR